MRFADIWNLVDSAFADIARMIDAKSNWQLSESSEALHAAGQATARASKALADSLANVKSENDHQNVALLQRVISNHLMPVLAALNNCAVKEQPSHEPETPRLITTPLAKAIEDEIAKADVKSTERFAMDVQRSNLGQILLWLATPDDAGTGHLIVFLRSLARNRSDLLDDAKSFIATLGTLDISQGFVQITPTVRVPIDQVGSQTARILLAKAYLAEKDGLQF